MNQYLCCHHLLQTGFRFRRHGIPRTKLTPPTQPLAPPPYCSPASAGICLAVPDIKHYLRCGQGTETGHQEKTQK